MNWRASCLLACWLSLGRPHRLRGIEPGKDPVPSVMWAFYHKQMLGDAPFVFDERVKLLAPPFAEDARQVPAGNRRPGVQGRGGANPRLGRTQSVAENRRLPAAGSVCCRGCRSAFASNRPRPLRAAVLTRDGVWHVGSTLIDAAGGGCTAPSVVRTQPGWEEHIGEVLGGRYPRGEFSRLRLQVAHPMDNGMVSGIPEFFINHAELRDSERSSAGPPGAVSRGQRKPQPGL